MRQRQGSPNTYEGLDAKTASRRARAIKKRMRDRARGLVDYSPLPGDKGARTRKSRYSKTEEARAVREFMALGFDFITSASMVSDIKCQAPNDWAKVNVSRRQYLPYKPLPVVAHVWQIPPVS